MATEKKKLKRKKLTLNKGSLARIAGERLTYISGGGDPAIHAAHELHDKLKERIDKHEGWTKSHPGPFSPKPQPAHPAPPAGGPPVIGPRFKRG